MKKLINKKVIISIIAVVLVIAIICGRNERKNDENTKYHS